ncbi:RNase P modulator RnpM [Chloroflexota bacterium]
MFLRKKKSISHQVPVKHIPQRTCIACRRVMAKRELIRLVRISDGSVDVDISGKRVGRGAYLCQAQECWETGLKGNRLEHVLRTSLTRENREHLIRYRKDFVQEVYLWQRQVKRVKLTSQ